MTSDTPDDGAAASDDSAKPSTKKKTPLIVVAVVAAILLITAVVVSVSGGEDSGPKTGANGELIYDVKLGEMWVKPSKISVKPGSHVVVNVTNTGDMDHDLKLNGKTGTPMLAPGEKNTADFGVITASTTAWCTVPEHKASGMLMNIDVDA